jgi:hypothetical protein
VALSWHRSLEFSVGGVATDADGNVYVTGMVPFGAPGDMGQPVAMVLEKRGPDGERLWIARWESDSARYPDAAGRDVAVSPDSSVVYVAGADMLPPWEAEQGRLWAYSSGGELLWTERTDMSQAVATTSDGAVIGGGGQVGAVGEDGNWLWREVFEEPSGPHCDGVEDLATAPDGDFYAVGYLDATPTCGSLEGGAYEDADVVIQRRAPNGALVWSLVLADPGVTDNDWGRAVDAAGAGIFVAGEVDGRAWLARVSASGEIVWERSWGGPAPATDADAAAWDAVYVTDGETLRRFAPDGQLVWARRRDVDAGEVLSGVATAPEGLVYMAGDVFPVEGDLWLVPA